MYTLCKIKNKANVSELVIEISCASYKELNDHKCSNSENSNSPNYTCICNDKELWHYSNSSY